MANMPLLINVGTLAAIVDVVEGEFPKFKKFLTEGTGHDAASGYYMGTNSGKRRLEPFAMKIAWDKSEQSHTQVMNLFIADMDFEMELQDPDSNETIAFRAHMEEVERYCDQEDIMITTAMVHPTGAPTIT